MAFHVLSEPLIYELRTTSLSLMMPVCWNAVMCCIVFFSFVRQTLYGMDFVGLVCGSIFVVCFIMSVLSSRVKEVANAFL